MKKKFGFGGRALCAALALFIIFQSAHLSIAALAEVLGGTSSGILPEVGSGDWEIPEATENKNNVDMTINNGIVYTDEVYSKLIRWGYVGGYKGAGDPLSSGGWRDFTASTSVLAPLYNEKYHNNAKGTWIDNAYATTVVKKSNGSYGIYKDLLVPTLRLGGNLNIERGFIQSSDLWDMLIASKANLEQATLRIGAWGGSSAKIQYVPHDSSYNPLLSFTPSSGRIRADVNVLDIYAQNNNVMPAVYLEVDGSLHTMYGMHAVMIDNTSPSIQNVEVNQSGDELVVTLTTNEGVRWAADAVRGDLDDVWVEVELGVIGTDYTQRVRAHVASIDYKYGLKYDLSKSDYTNKIVFKGDLGPFADLDYKILRITDTNLPKEDYAITFGKMQVCAYQLKDTKIRNEVLSYWDAENEVTVYETYNTTAICDTAGNPLNLEAIVNWPINQTEVKNDSTFVRIIELNNSKLDLGQTTPTATDFAEDISRADYFFGPDDVIAPKLYLNRVLSESEINSFKLTLNVKDKDGKYLTLTPKSSSTYKIGDEEFTQILFNSLTLTQSMSADAQNGNRAYLEVTKVECELTDSPPFLDILPSAEKTLYLDLTAPTVTVNSKSLEIPTVKDGYYSLDIEVVISDVKIDGEEQSGMLEQDAYFYLEGNVNEKTPIKYFVDDKATPPALEKYESTELYEGKRVKLGDKAVGMTSISENKVYVHLLIPEKANLLIDGVTLYTDVSDAVGNRVDTEKGYSIKYSIDTQLPVVSFTDSDTVFTSNSAVTTVKVAASDYNNVTSLSYQWVAAGESYDNGKWESLVIGEGPEINASITKEFIGLEATVYDVALYVKCADERGNESAVIKRDVKINIEKPVTSYELLGDPSIPSTHPELTVNGPSRSFEEKTGYTRVTVSPINPGGVWAYATVVKSGESLDLFDFENEEIEWYKVSYNASRYYSVEYVDGEVVTLDELKKYYGNLKISFENAYSDLTPEVGFLDKNVSDGSYIADQNFLTVRFASQDGDIKAVNSVSFESVKDKSGAVLAQNGAKGNTSILISTDTRGTNGMRGVSFYFNIKNVRMSDWALLDLDFENSTVELLRSDTETQDELVYLVRGLSKSESQYFTIPAYTMDEGWFETGVYKIRVTVKSNSGSTDVFESLNVVYDAGTPEKFGLVSYSHDLRYESGAYRTAYSGEPVDSFGIAVSPGHETNRNNVFAVYSGGVTGFSFTIGAADTSATYDGYTVGAVEGFRYWNRLSAPTELELAGYKFTRYNSTGDPALVVTSGVSSIYTEETIPKGALGLGDIYLVEGVNTICYQIKMANGYVTPVHQFTIIVTRNLPEFNVIVSDYTPSYYAAQRDGQVNAHDITMKIEEAFSLNGSGNVNVELWTNYAATVNGEWVEQTDENSLTLSLTTLVSGLTAGDTAVLTEDSYTSTFPPYSGQGNQCSAVFVAIDEYGGMSVYAPQIGALSRLNDPSDPYDDLITIEYSGSYVDDPFVIGKDLSYIEYYNDAVYFGAELVGFQNIRTDSNGVSRVIETSIPELQYNLFAISRNDVEFSRADTAWAGDRKTTSATWDVSAGDIQNYSIIDWDNTVISFYTEDGLELALELNVWNPGINSAGFIGGGYGEAYSPTTNERWSQFSLNFANPKSDAEHPAYNWNESYNAAENLNSQKRVRYVMRGINLLGDEFEMSGSIDLRYIDYGAVSEEFTESGINLNLPFVSSNYGDVIRTGVFNGRNDAYSFTVLDAYGNSRTISGSYVTPDYDEMTEISFSTLKDTSGAVTVTLTAQASQKIYVDVIDGAVMSLDGNGTDEVTVTLTDNVRFGYKYVNPDNGDVVERMLTVSNIKKPNPRIEVDTNTDIVLVDENGTKYRYGNLVIKLVDDNFTLTDSYTGRAPSHTFTPGGESSYTFSKYEILATLGDEAPIAIPESLTYTIDFELREIIDPLLAANPSDAPSLKIKAFKDNGGYYKDESLSLILEPSGISETFLGEEETVLRYSGNRANASVLLRELGWGTSYRFLAEVGFDGAYKTFIKEGIYSEAPDYETGESDNIDGVTLNSRLLTVEKNASFTFFAVASNGNYVSVAFDVTNIGSAPKPTLKKLPVGEAGVRVYIIAPEGVTDFTPSPADPDIILRTDSEGEFAGIPYVEYGKNDEYLINYSFKLGDDEIEGAISTSIYEIRLREMKQNGVVSWSANKLFATDKSVSATISFSEVIRSVEADRELDGTRVELSHSGRQLTVKFNDNHEGFTLKVGSDYGEVTLDLEGVSNIDRDAPVVREASRVVSDDFKKVTVTISTSERTVFREGGYIGEAKLDEGGEIYVYTREFTENGSYTYHFTDMSGIESEITLLISEIVDEPLTVYFSLDKKLEGAVESPDSFDLKVGDKVYVSTNRAASVFYNGEDKGKASVGEWLEILLTDGIGGESPYVTVTDDFGNVVIKQFRTIAQKDKNAPIITVAKAVVTATAGIRKSDATELLLENIHVTDEDENLTYKVEFTDGLTVSGVFPVTYTVTDSEGNYSVAECKIRITSASEPKITVNGKSVDRDGSYYAALGEELRLTVEVGGQPYTAYFDSGIKTVAQMKHGSTDITDGYVREEELILPTLEGGYYTLIIQTQSRDYFRIIFYVYK